MEEEIERELMEVNEDLHSLTNLQLVYFLDNVTQQVLEILMDREEGAEEARNGTTQ